MGTFGTVDAVVAVDDTFLRFGVGFPSPSIVPRHFSYTSLPHRSPHCDFTHRNIDQAGEGVDERPDPLAAGLRVDGAGRRADAPTVEHPGLCLGYTFIK